MEATKRRSRKHRTPLGILQRYRYLDANHIYALLGSRNSNVRGALSDLFHEHGLLDRLPQRAFMRDPLYDPEIYELSDDGAMFIAQQAESIEPATWLKQGRYGAKTLAAHNLTICHAVASIEAAAASSGLRFMTCTEILARAPKATQEAKQPFAIPVSISHLFPGGKVQRSDTPVIPDAVFGLQYPNGSYRCFALEIDRATMPLTRSNLDETSYLRKLLQYREVLSRGAYKTHFGMTATPMLLLTITTTPGTWTASRRCCATSQVTTSGSAPSCSRPNRAWGAFNAPLNPHCPCSARAGTVSAIRRFSSTARRTEWS
jgi:hypothetical protein